MTDLLDGSVRRVQTLGFLLHAEHSYMNSGTVRKSTAARYRQWLTHKLATWHDQFGSRAASAAAGASPGARSAST